MSATATILPILALAVAGIVTASIKIREHRRWSKVKASGGRKSFALNLIERP